MKYFYDGVIGLAFMGMSIAFVAESHTVKKQQKIDVLESAFEKAGSPVPSQMAKAVRQTKRPELMAAIAIQESDGTPWAKGKAGEKGAFQVIEKDWGKVSQHPDEQAKQAERILDELLEASKGNELKAIAMYNGGAYPNKKAYKYADSVILKWKKLKGEVSGKNS